MEDVSKKAGPLKPDEIFEIVSGASLEGSMFRFWQLAMAAVTELERKGEIGPVDDSTLRMARFAGQCIAVAGDVESGSVLYKEACSQQEQNTPELEEAYAA